jgi:cyclopropane fatty-acyl-phospholipid synthase-like methyltransferase
MSAVIALVFFIVLISVITSVVNGAPLVVTDEKTLKNLIKMADIKGDDLVADLGSGDGRLVIAMAQKGARVHGYEINPILVIYSRMKIRALGLSGKAKVYWRSYWGADLKGYDLVVVFGISYIMKRLEEKLAEELTGGSRIITHTYKLPHIKPSESKDGVYLYEI